MSMDIGQRCILDINTHIRPVGHLLTGDFDPACQFRNLALRFGDLVLAFPNLGIKIGHFPSFC